MAEALEMAKKKLGLNLPPGDGQARDKPKDPVKELEDQIAQEQDFDKRQGLLLQLRELRLQRELRVKDLEARLRKGGKVDGDGEQETEERGKQALADRQKLMGQAKALIDSGLAPQQVGQMLMGLPIMASSAGVPTVQGLTITDALKIVDLVVERKSEGELKALVLSLQRKIEGLEKGGSGGGTSTPPDRAQEAATWIRSSIDALRELGVPIGEAARGSVDESIETQKEKNRHLEEMERLSAEREHKQEMAKVASDIPKSIGRGLARQLREEGGEKDEGAPKGVTAFACDECHKQVYVPPDAGDVILCPHCGQKYEKGKKS